MNNDSRNNGSAKKVDTLKLVGVSLFTAIVLVLQYLGSFIKLGPFSISLVLIPIVIGAALYGRAAGAWLGLAFGLAVLISGDAAPFLAINVFGTVVVVLLKGLLAGLAAGVVYKLVEKLNVTVAVIAAAVVCPVVNTGVFLLGCLVFFMDTIRTWAEGMGFTNVYGFMFLGLVGANFLFELAFNMVLSPVIVRLIQLGRKAKLKSV